MTTRLGILLLIGLLVPLPAVAAGPSPAERAQHIDLMTGILREADVRKFMDRVKSEGWQCPIIDSAWRLREMTPAEERVSGSAARSLGKQAMIAIDAQRDSIWSLEGQELLTRVRAILDLGDWFGQSRGYGNVLVQWRSRELAIGGLGRLVADLSFPLESLQAERERLHGSLHPIAARVAVLNHEAGSTLFPATIRSVRDLELYWAAGGWHHRRFSREPRLPDDAVGRKVLVEMGINPDRADSRTSFFLDEPCPAPVTKLNCWDHKSHYNIMGSAGGIRELDALVEFRKVVGSFPLKPAEPRPALDDGHVAFIDSWEAKKGVGVGGRLVPSSAWDAYKQIKAARFGDADSQTGAMWQRENSPKQGHEMVPHGVPPPGTCLENIAALSSTLQRDGLKGLSLVAFTREYAFPRIDSMWRLRALSGEELQCQEKSRDFGRDVLVHLDGIRTPLGDESGESLYQHVVEILDIADWIGAQEGYGNAIVQKRAREVVMMGLGRLVLDLSFPLERVRSQTPRLRGGLNIPSVRARILNHEAGWRLFPEGIESTEMLVEYWRVGLAKAHRKRLGPGSILRQSDVRMKLTEMGLDPEKDQEIDAFFLDGDCPAPYTTLACWNSKRHEQLVGDLSTRLQQIDSLMRFREVVGEFPMKAKHPFPPRPEGMVAFDEAWEAKMGPIQESALPQDAFGAYLEIELGHFGDYELILARRYSSVAQNQGRVPSETHGPSAVPKVETPTP